MVEVIARRVSPRIEGDFVLFLIGMRINRPWKVMKWLPAFCAMPRMIRELEASGPESGFLGHAGLRPRLTVQYWRSFEHLERYARSRDHAHWPAWVEFNRRMRDSRGDVGIWHETYLVPAGRFEAVYSGMPLFGLAKAAEAVAAADESGARDRLVDAAGPRA